MNDLTDYEINKRLAGISEVSVAPDGENRVGIEEGLLTGEGDEWPPLTDWSQLGPLMEAFISDIRRVPGSRQHSAECWCDEPGESHGMYTASSLPRAICLAIIAAHDQND
jgi:hypothetical protein